MTRFLSIAILGLLLMPLSCGKNAPIIGGYSPYAQAPYPGAIDPNTGMPIPMPGYGGYPAYPGVPSFTPQLPPGYPAAYTPFLPVDFFMRNNPQLAGYWPSFWSQWVVFSSNMGYSVYDFSRFWFTFCPQRWNTPGFSSLYGYLNQSFYPWMQPGISFSPSMSPSAFWQGYSGYSYGPAWSYSYSYGH